MISPGLNTIRAAGLPLLILVIKTPFVKRLIPCSSATAGERLTTVAPEMGCIPFNKVFSLSFTNTFSI